MSFINDTTLRDGEQAPFVAFNTKEKLQIARLLYENGADELEIGIPAMGKKEQSDIKEILSLNLPLQLMSWNRATLCDLEASLACGIKAVDLSIPVSNTLIDIKYKNNKKAILRNLELTISLAKKEGLFVCIGAEDSSRMDIDFVKDVLSLGENLQVNRFRYCDTVGILTPIQTYEEIKRIKQLTNLEIEMHTHNDFGMATANAIAGLQAGAISINTTVIGLGERAGNASFEQALMSLKHQIGENRQINASKLQQLVKFVSLAAKKNLSDTMPIVGKHLFAHESGIHVNGLMKNSSTYEPYEPSSVGLIREFPIGKHSGSSSLAFHLKAFGIDADYIKLQQLLPQVREMVTNRKKVLKANELKEMYLCL